MDHIRHQLNPGLTQQEDNPEVLRRKIQHTQAEIGDTVNSIQERLSPERMKQQIKTAAREQLESVKDNVRFKAEQWQSQVAERIVNNPIPAAMVGAGLVWMLKQASCSRHQLRPSQSYYSLDPYEDWPDYAPEEKSGRLSPSSSRAQDTLRTVKAKGQTSGQQVRAQITEWATQTQDSLEELKSRTSYQTDQIRERGERAKKEFQRYFQDSPLTMGAVALGIGVAVGLSLPRTQKEDRLLGETRDKLLEQAKATAKEIIPKAQEVAGEIKQTTREAIKEHMRETLA